MSFDFSIVGFVCGLEIFYAINRAIGCFWFFGALL